MAKAKAKSNSRKPSSRKKVSKELIKQAQYAKSKGLLSKLAKLQNGRASRSVIKKITALEELGAVPTYIFRPGSKKPEIQNSPTKSGVKLKRKMIREAKARGFEVFNGHTIVENTKAKDAQKRVANGYLVGMSTDVIEERNGERKVLSKISRISLTKYNIQTFRELIEALRDGSLDIQAKEPSDWYTFTYDDFHPNPNSTFNHGQRRHEQGASTVFRNGQELAQYLLKYEKIFDAYDTMDHITDFNHFELYRIVQGYRLGPTPDYVYQAAATKWRSRTIQDRRQANRIRKMRMKAEQLKTQRDPNALAKERMARMRARLTPEQKEEVKAKDRARKARNRVKGKNDPRNKPKD